MSAQDTVPKRTRAEVCGGDMKCVQFGLPNCQIVMDEAQTKEILDTWDGSERQLVLASAGILLTEATRAAAIFREYEAHHLAKPDKAKAARNACMAGRLERAVDIALTASIEPK